MYKYELISTLMKIMRSSTPESTYNDFFQWGKLQFSNDDILRHIDKIKEGETPDHIRNCEKVKALVLGRSPVSNPKKQDSLLEAGQTYLSICTALRAVGEDPESEYGKKLLDKFQKNDPTEIKEIWNKLRKEDWASFFKPNKDKSKRMITSHKSDLEQAIRILLKGRHKERKNGLAVLKPILQKLIESP